MINILLNLLFPQEECYICRHPGNYNSRKPWCDDCCIKMNNLKNKLPYCQICGKFLFTNASICQECSISPPLFALARAVGPYKGEFCKAVHVLKFLGRRQLACRMGNLMAQKVKEEAGYFPLDIIVPVPISRLHLQRRGFNQSELLAVPISRCLALPLKKNLLVRTKETPAQTELSREEREKNLLFAFKAKNEKQIIGKNILLVDDVYTTGSTCRECTRVLLEAGAQKVCLITWATGIGY